MKRFIFLTFAFLFISFAIFDIAFAQNPVFDFFRSFLFRAETFSCTGEARPCSNIYYYYQCANQLGCQYSTSPPSCKGTALPCSKITDSYSCSRQLDCSWTGATTTTTTIPPAPTTTSIPTATTTGTGTVTTGTTTTVCNPSDIKNYRCYQGNVISCNLYVEYCAYGCEQPCSTNPNFGACCKSATTTTATPTTTPIATATTTVISTITATPPPPQPCLLNSVSISPLCSNGNSPDCEPGEKISVSASYSSSCPSVSYIQVNAKSSDGLCTICDNGRSICSQTACNINGIQIICDSGNCSGEWTIPLISASCQGKKVFAQTANLFDNYFCSGGDWYASAKPSGSFTFVSILSTPTSTETTTTSITCESLGYRTACPRGFVCKESKVGINLTCCSCAPLPRPVNRTTQTTTTQTTKLPTLLIPREDKTFPKVEADLVISEKFNKTSLHTVEKITLATEKDESNVLLRVEKIAAKPSELPEPPVVPYNYLKIESNFSSLKGVNISFFVKTSWINENNLDENKIFLLRYDGKWNKLPTKLVKKTNSFNFYEAISSGLSIFVVGGEKAEFKPSPLVEVKCPSCPPPSEWSSCTNNLQRRAVYSCDSSTNYQCKVSFESRSCNLSYGNSLIFASIVLILLFSVSVLTYFSMTKNIVTLFRK